MLIFIRIEWSNKVSYMFCSNKKHKECVKV